MTDVKLYNMDLGVQEWREGKFQRGDTWRSDAIYACEICGVCSNRWIMGGAPGMGPRMVCKGTQYTEHERIEGYIQRRDYLENLLKDASAVPDVELLRGEYRTIDVAVQNLRDRFAGRFDDIVGEPQRTVVYYPSSKYMATEPLPEK